MFNTLFASKLFYLSPFFWRMIHLHEIFPSFFWKTVQRPISQNLSLYRYQEAINIIIIFTQFYPWKQLCSLGGFREGTGHFKIWFSWTILGKNAHAFRILYGGGFMVPCSRTRAVWKWSKDVSKSKNCEYLIYFKWNNTWLFWVSVLWMGSKNYYL